MLKHPHTKASRKMRKKRRAVAKHCETVIEMHSLRFQMMPVAKLRASRQLKARRFAIVSSRRAAKNAPKKKPFLIGGDGKAA